MRRMYAIAIVITALTCAATGTLAAWPEKPLQLIVAYPPGGLTDALARAVAKPLGERLKQPIVVKNVPGGGGNIGAAKAAKSPADGHTVYIGNNATVGLNTLAYKALPFDPLTELAPVILIVESQSILVVHPGVAATSVNELMAHATQRQFVHTHRWRANDLVMCDNRCTMHRGTEYDERRWKRDMHRATVSDVGNTCEAQAQRMTTG